MQFIIVIPIILLACGKSVQVGDCGTRCNENIACTEVFISIVVQVENALGVGVNLNNVSVQRKSDGEIILKNKKADLAKDGKYVLFTDSEIDETSQCGEEFLFKGYKDGKLVVNETFEVAHNCCHVFLKSGNTTIVVDN